jgi:ribose transport system ATP-binding protein
MDPTAAKTGAPSRSVSVAETNALDAEGMSKTFGATRALRGASLSVAGGEVHGLVGANGCGKSTLIKILTGLYVPDEGSLAVWGQTVGLPVRKPTDIGISVVHQRLGLQPDATVVESFGSGVGYSRNRMFCVNWRAERARCRAMADRLGVAISPTARIRELPAAQRTVVAIMRALRNLQSTGDRHVLILDEPTVSMSPKEVAILQAVLHRLIDQGDAVVLVSHRLSEVLNLCSRVTVLRDGQNQGTFATADLDQPTLLHHMLGRQPIDMPPAAERVDERRPQLSLQGLSGDLLDGLTVDLHRGEIIGFTGLVGSGHDEIPYLVAGSTPASTGRITLDGKPLPDGVRLRRRAGISVVPGDRARQALWLQASMAENISLPVLSGFMSKGALSKRREIAHAGKLMDDFAVRPMLPAAPADTFSGGNQQKVVLAAALQSEPAVLVLHEPTVGVDAGAKRQIYGIVRGAAASGTTVAVCSTDYEELAEYCDTVHVIGDGRLVSTLHGPGLTESDILSACNQSATAISTATAGLGPEGSGAE